MNRLVLVPLAVLLAVAPLQGQAPGGEKGLGIGLKVAVPFGGFADKASPGLELTGSAEVLRGRFEKVQPAVEAGFAKFGKKDGMDHKAFYGGFRVDWRGAQPLSMGAAVRFGSLGWSAFGMSDSDVALFVALLMQYELMRIRTAELRARLEANVPVASELQKVDLGLMIVF